MTSPRTTVGQCARCPETAFSNFSFTADGRYFSVQLCELHLYEMVKGPDRPTVSAAGARP